MSFPFLILTNFPLPRAQCWGDMNPDRTRPFEIFDHKINDVLRALLCWHAFFSRHAPFENQAHFFYVSQHWAWGEGIFTRFPSRNVLSSDMLQPEEHIIVLFYFAWIVTFSETSLFLLRCPFSFPRIINSTCPPFENRPCDVAVSNIHISKVQEKPHLPRIF